MYPTGYRSKGSRTPSPRLSTPTPLTAEGTRLTRGNLFTCSITEAERPEEKGYCRRVLSTRATRAQSLYPIPVTARVVPNRLSSTRLLNPKFFYSCLLPKDPHLVVPSTSSTVPPPALHVVTVTRPGRDRMTDRRGRDTHEVTPREGWTDGSPSGHRPCPCVRVNRTTGDGPGPVRVTITSLRQPTNVTRGPDGESARVRSDRVGRILLLTRTTASTRPGWYTVCDSTPVSPLLLGRDRNPSPFLFWRPVMAPSSVPSRALPSTVPSPKSVSLRSSSPRPSTSDPL